MAAIANIVLADALGTPVNHTFEPAKASADYALWEDRSAAYYIGYNRISMMLKRPTAGKTVGNRNIRAKLVVETPKLENTTNSTISGIAPAPTVSYRLSYTVEAVLPERCSLQDRKDIRKYVQTLMTSQPVIDLFETYNVAY
jgi:hypothetical protein